MTKIKRFICRECSDIVERVIRPTFCGKCGGLDMVEDSSEPPHYMSEDTPEIYATTPGKLFEKYGRDTVMDLGGSLRGVKAAIKAADALGKKLVKLDTCELGGDYTEAVTVIAWYFLHVFNSRMPYPPVLVSCDFQRTVNYLRSGEYTRTDFRRYIQEA